MSEDRVFLTPEQAISMLDPDAESIHTFLNPSAAMLVGADHDREDLVADIKKALTREIGGDSARNLNHGLVIEYRDAYLFVECAEDFDYDEFEREVKENTDG